MADGVYIGLYLSYGFILLLLSALFIIVGYNLIKNRKNETKALSGIINPIKTNAIKLYRRP